MTANTHTCIKSCYPPWQSQVWVSGYGLPAMMKDSSWLKFFSMMCVATAVEDTSTLAHCPTRKFVVTCSQRERMKNMQLQKGKWEKQRKHRSFQQCLIFLDLAEPAAVMFDQQALHMVTLQQCCKRGTWRACTNHSSSLSLSTAEIHKLPEDEETNGCSRPKQAANSSDVQGEMETCFSSSVPSDDELMSGKLNSAYQWRRWYGMLQYVRRIHKHGES